MCYSTGKRLFDVQDFFFGTDTTYQELWYFFENRSRRTCAKYQEQGSGRTILGHAADPGPRRVCWQHSMIVSGSFPEGLWRLSQGGQEVSPRKAGQHSSLYLDSIQARCDRLPLLVMLPYQCACVQSPSLLIQNEYGCLRPLQLIKVLVEMPAGKRLLQVLQVSRLNAN